MPKKTDFVSAARELGDVPFRFFCERREAFKADQTKPAEAAELAYAETVEKFKDEAAQTNAPPPKKPSDEFRLFECGEFATTNSVPIHKVFAWVAAHMVVSDVTPSSAPNSEAWGLLTWCRAHPDNMSSFYTVMYPKMLPNKTQLEQEGRFSDDGRNLSNFIARIRSNREAAVLQGGAKRPLPKPAFS